MLERSVVLTAFAFAIIGGSSAYAASYTSSYSDLDLGKCALVEEDSEFGFVQMKCEGRHGYDVYASEGDLRLHLAYRKPGQPLIAEEEFVESLETEELATFKGEDVVVAEEVLLDPDVLVEAAPSHSEAAENVVAAGGAELEEQAEAFVPVGVRPIGQTIAPFNNLGPKLEWRAPNRAGAEPFATIVRYTYQKMADDGSYSDGQVLVVSHFRNGESCHIAYIDALANPNANVMAREVADKYGPNGGCVRGSVPVLGLGGDEFRFQNIR
jgi:hypothetical protein